MTKYTSKSFEMLKFVRIEAGRYRAGEIEIRDQYSQDGSPNARSLAKNGRRWAIFNKGEFVRRESTLADAKETAQRIA